MMMKDKCPHCGAKMRQYKHKLNEPLIQALFILMQFSGEANIAKIGLTHNQVCNFQKLRYWDIVEKGDEDGVWKITRHGYDFITDREFINEYVITYHGERIRYEGELVSAFDYLDKNFWKRLDYKLNSESLSDENGKLF